ncbi:MAG: insulinase family protein [Acidobacteria bacterium]|nr:insulinase family protein [Acidobacteriota bacterium]
MNGLQIIVAPTPYLDESMAIGLVVRYGSAFDMANKGGVANLLSRMFMKATVDRTSADIQEELEFLGATLDVTCDWDGFRFMLKGNSASFERALLLLYQVVCEARFTEEDLSAVKRQILEELQPAPDPRTQILDQFEKRLFRGTTYGRSPRGIPEIVATMTPGDIRYYYRRHFSPADASLLVVGNVSPEQVLQKATRIWGLWIRKDRIPHTFAPAREPDKDIHLIEDDPDSAAVHFILGNFSPRRADPLFGNVVLAARILRDRLRNLLPTSLLTVGLDGRRMPGSFYIQGQAAAEDAVEQILKIQDAVEEMKRVPVSAQELADTQNRIIEEFNKELKTTDGLCRIMLDSELFRLGSNYATAFPDRIRNCDAAMIRQVARDYFIPGKKIVILKGSVNVLKSELNRLGEFERFLR